MKLIFITDIHDALKELRVLLSTTEADVYLLCGDILYKAFYDDDKIYQFVSLQEELYALARKLDQKIYPFDLAADILRFPQNYREHGDDLQASATEYRHLFEKATKTMKEKYELIEELIHKYNDGAQCILLPGNYDIDLRYTALKSRDLHNRSVTINGIKFAGYGGAPIATSGIPEKLAVVYHENNRQGKMFSEPESFFNEQRPDVMVLHNPAYGFFDRIPSVGHVGSHGCRNYLDDHKPMLVVSGHVHEDYGIANRHGTILTNPSNFGGVDSPYGWQQGGMYSALEISGGGSTPPKVESMDLFCLTVEEEHHPLMHVDVDGPGLKGQINRECISHSPLDLSGFVRDASGAPVYDD